MSAADIIDTFEGSYAQYLTYTPPSWTSNYPATDFSNIVYTTPTISDMINAIARSQAENVGWVYVTNLAGANPYDALPGYWADEVDWVAGARLQGPLEITSTSPLPDGSVRVAYSSTLSVTGGNPPYKWSLSSGHLPPGLHIHSDGVISGKPDTTGTCDFTAVVVDTKTKSTKGHPSTQNTGAATFSITVS
jgi:hypothetical protein